VIDQEGKHGVALQTEFDNCTRAKDGNAGNAPLSMQPDFGSMIASNGNDRDPSHSIFFGSHLQPQSVPVTRPSVTSTLGYLATPDYYTPTEQMKTHVQSQIRFSSTFPANHATLPCLESVRDGNVNDDLVQSEIETLEDSLQQVGRRFTVEQIMRAGLKALSQEAQSRQTIHEEAESTSHHPQLRTDKILVFQNSEPNAAAELPDLRRNNFRMKQAMWVAACVANATHLGLTFAGTNCDDASSPFFRDSISEEVAKTTCQSSFNNLKEHLRPTPSQVLHQHHPYIDVLPFPTFRERLIKLAYMDTPMIDEDELCHDLENDGLICWGSSLGGGSVATGSGAPWDIRSWEAQPWFLKKWWILIGGVEGELYKQTQWWREMRGEKSCYPW
jgi:hypothetical protein